MRGVAFALSLNGLLGMPFIEASGLSASNPDMEIYSVLERSGLSVDVHNGDWFNLQTSLLECARTEKQIVQCIIFDAKRERKVSVSGTEAQTLMTALHFKLGLQQSQGVLQIESLSCALADDGRHAKAAWCRIRQRS